MPCEQDDELPQLLSTTEEDAVLPPLPDLPDLPELLDEHDNAAQLDRLENELRDSQQQLVLVRHPQHPKKGAHGPPSSIEGNSRAGALSWTQRATVGRLTSRRVVPAAKASSERLTAAANSLAN